MCDIDYQLDGMTPCTSHGLGSGFADCALRFIGLHDRAYGAGFKVYMVYRACC